MTLLEVAIITGTSFNERKVPDLPVDHRWPFSLHGVEVKDRDILIGAYGSGRTLPAAKRDYAKQLQSKMIVVNTSDYEVLLPPKITVK